MKCRNCNADAPVGKKFCGDCGAALTQACAKCGAENPPGNRFCGECGAPITSPIPGAASVSKDVEPTKPVEGERRRLTVLFCDLVGSTEIASGMDPEQWHAIASDYQKDAAVACERFGGHVSKFLG